MSVSGSAMSSEYKFRKWGAENAINGFAAGQVGKLDRGDGDAG